MYYPMYFDPTYILVLIGVVICLFASAKVNSTYAKYDRVRNHAGITGAMAAEQILRRAGIYDVRIERVSGRLSDHYDPANKVVRLSDSTYGSTSVAALGAVSYTHLDVYKRQVCGSTELSICYDRRQRRGDQSCH